ncbi:hypothetical protein WBP06_18385 (plasmid) [Novosphingobium sp. BL-8H]|uniref:hypothetical protein n=1 Tax=Novosphingobium sp. BL-8H TaxID=3127640 RepID=UPI003757DB0A
MSSNVREKYSPSAVNVGAANAGFARQCVDAALYAYARRGDRTVLCNHLEGSFTFPALSEFAPLANASDKLVSAQQRFLAAAALIEAFRAKGWGGILDDEEEVELSDWTVFSFRAVPISVDYRNYFLPVQDVPFIFKVVTDITLAVRECRQ